MSVRGATKQLTGRLEPHNQTERPAKKKKTRGRKVQENG